MNYVSSHLRRCVKGGLGGLGGLFLRLESCRPLGLFFRLASGFCLSLRLLGRPVSEATVTTANTEKVATVEGTKYPESSKDRMRGPEHDEQQEERERRAAQAEAIEEYLRALRSPLLHDDEGFETSATPMTMKLEQHLYSWNNDEEEDFLVRRRCRMMDVKQRVADRGMGPDTYCSSEGCCDVRFITTSRRRRREQYDERLLIPDGGDGSSSVKYS